MAQYIIRLDDLCHNSNLEKWERFFNLFDQYDIKPIIAAIPANKDPKLMSCGPYNPNYWELLRRLQSLGYMIGMHGYDHLYVSKNSGIFKFNKRSEFAGLPISIQSKKLAAAARMFDDEKINVKIFIAPAHSLDYCTLRALKSVTRIKIISEGLLPFPYKRRGFNWLPVQQNEAELQGDGVWTFNYHPETCTDKAFLQLKKFIADNHKDFIPLNTLHYRPYQLEQMIAEKYLIYKRWFSELIKSTWQGVNASVYYKS
ncbi:MAG TPA: DUF2334 domain-containing protein [Mucilaginibacter sp.]|jgi:hypothetical protein|nr:DUF2334 domain-containing protein [Mucilaginibacter sp.]